MARMLIVFFSGPVKARRGLVMRILGGGAIVCCILVCIVGCLCMVRNVFDSLEVGRKKKSY
jgi:hypothetical protein